jgi:2-hydroxychromene-2-carboxylate isomerase
LIQRSDNVPEIDFWFEYGSTYTYLTVARVGRLADEAGVKVRWRPFLLMPLMIEHGMTQGPFLPFPQKMAYMWRDLERRAQRHGIPYRRPSRYPPESTIATARIGVLAASEGWCREFTERTFALHWTEDRMIGSEDTVQTVLRALGKAPEEVLARAQSPAGKEALKTQTERARKLGLFGSPSFIVGEELFWGDDRLEEAIDWAVSF